MKSKWLIGSDQPDDAAAKSESRINNGILKNAGRSNRVGDNSRRDAQPDEKRKELCCSTVEASRG